jgi:hypothetical protein
MERTIPGRSRPPLWWVPRSSQTYCPPPLRNPFDCGAGYTLSYEAQPSQFSE